MHKQWEQSETELLARQVSTTPPRRSFSLVALVAGLSLLTASFAVHSHSLHKTLHSTSESGHFCFITVLGQELVTIADREVTQPVFICGLALTLLDSFDVLLPLINFHSPCGRAPPSLLPSSRS